MTNLYLHVEGKKTRSPRFLLQPILLFCSILNMLYPSVLSRLEE